MKVLCLLRTALFLSAVVGTAHVATAKKHKLCEGGPAPDAKPVVSQAPPQVTPAPPTTPAPTTSAPSTPAPTTTQPTQQQQKPQGPTPGPQSTAPAASPSSAPGPAPGGKQQSKAGGVKASFSYKGKDGGHPGSYNMVTDINTCAKAPRAMSSPVSPLDDDVTLVFRGPMTIHNIAVFDGSSGSWTKVSSYCKDSKSSNNLVFLNNRNIDFGGKSAPQGFSTADGTGTAQQSTQFAGVLGGASNLKGFFAHEKTGAEVNIFQDKKCGKDGECPGYYDKDGTAHIGWAGGKKIFVTKVHMPQGPAPNLPAVWMLNGQIVRSNQYQCNCRGMGAAGGCGELDIAEVIEKDTSVVATHYYLYEGGTGHDSWGKRPFDGPTTYVTIIDETYGVKVLEIGADDFDFECGSISGDVVSKWLSA